ncbi:MAG: CHAT domain-containing tetratricopeptide repeat protein [Caldilineaceae bacterium]
MQITWQELLSFSDSDYRTWLQTHPLARTISLLEAGKSYLETVDHWPLARRALKRLAQLAYALADPVAIALFWRIRANELQYYQHFEQSIHASRFAAAIYSKHGTVLDVAKARTAEVFCLRALERFSEAIELALWIRPHYENSAFPLGDARLSHALAGVYAATWRLDEALSEYQRAMECFRQLELENDQVDCLQNMGVLSHKLDRLEDAQNYYLQAYTYFEQHKRVTMQVKTLFNLAQNLMRMNQFDEALHNLARSRQLLNEMAESADHAYADFFEAQIRQRLNQLPQAEGLLRQAILRFEHLGQRLEATQPRLALANLLSATSLPAQLNDAQENLELAHSLAREFDLPIFAALLLLERAEILVRLQRSLEAIEDVEAARVTFASSGLSLRKAQAEIVLADCYGALHPEQARLLYEQALGTVGDVVPILAVRCHRGLGKLASAINHFQSAEDHYQQAIHSLDTLRRSLQSHFHQAGFQEDAFRLSEELLHTIQQQSGREQQLFSWVEHFKAASLADLLAGQPPDATLDEELYRVLAERETIARQLDLCSNAVLNNHSTQLAASGQRSRELAAHDTHQLHEINELRIQLQRLDESLTRRHHPSINWRAGMTTRVEEVQHLLDQDAVLISYFSIHNRLHALTLTPDDLQYHPLPVDLHEVDKQWAMAKRFVMRPEGDSRRAQQYLGQLYRNLLEPFVTRLVDKKRLIILPHRNLTQIPFAGLFDAQEHRYAIQRWTIQLSPSATILAHCRHLPHAKKNPLLIGYPGEPSQVDYLTNVQSEIEELAQLLPNCRSYYGSDATLDNAMCHMPGSQIIHLAGHNWFDSSNPLASGMPLADGRWLRAADLYLRYGFLQGALVVLGGCDTARGAISGGEIVGLSSAYLYAGASAIVTSLWSVDDEATRTLMRLFYRNMTRNQDIATALASAQRDLINGEMFAAPYFWSPFTLSGDNRTLQS